MLVFDIRTLVAGAVSVDDVLAPDDPVWEEGDARPRDPIQVTGRLSSAGAGGDRFYFSGNVQGMASDDCRRCLTNVTTGISEHVQLLFAAEGTEGSEDPDVFVFDPRLHDLDLRPAIREQWLLSVPAYVVCGPDCKGLCATCGTDLNVETCQCAPAGDARWASLREMQEKGR